MSDIQHDLAYKAFDALEDQRCRSLFVDVELPETDARLMIQIMLVEGKEVESAKAAFDGLNEFAKQLVSKSRAEAQLKQLQDELDEG